MITAVDTNVLRDVLGADPEFGEHSRDALRRSLHDGKVIACDGVWAETCASFRSSSEGIAALHRLGVEFSETDERTATAAGDSWRSYRARGGKRERIVTDFLIGAHATRHADRLLTRDRGFYRRYFQGLEILDPASPR
ncbi:MAG: type II toxin-antitoxin system VapC family toxin [Actinomycetota bacterium]